MILHIFCVLVIAVSSAICAPGPEVLQDLSVEDRQNDNRKPSDPQGNLDPIGGPNMVKIDDLEEDELFHSLETLDSLQEALIENLDEFPRYGNWTPPPDTRGTLDPIGGDSIFRIVKPDEEEIFHATDIADNLQDTLTENLDELAQYEIENEEEILRSLERLENRKDVLIERLEELPRYGNLTPPPDTRGTLDSIGGGNLVRVVETDEAETIFQPLDTSDSSKIDEEDMSD